MSPIAGGNCLHRRGVPLLSHFLCSDGGGGGGKIFARIEWKDTSKNPQEVKTTPSRNPFGSSSAGLNRRRPSPSRAKAEKLYFRDRTTADLRETTTLSSLWSNKLWMGISRKANGSPCFRTTRTSSRAALDSPPPPCTSPAAASRRVLVIGAPAAADRDGRRRGLERLIADETESAAKKGHMARARSTAGR